MSAAVTNDELRAIEQFLYQEASFLDRSDLDGWIALYTDDGTYWMPVTPEQEDPINHISLFYDDRTIMEIRRRNITHPRAASKELPIRCSHIIGNVQVLDNTAEQAQGELTVTSNFHCVIYAADEQTLFAGTYTHVLVRTESDFKIRSKRVDLINCDAALGAILTYI